MNEERRTNNDFNSCPFCKQPIDAGEQVCPHCQKSIVDAPTVLQAKTPFYRKPVFYVICTILVILALLGGAALGTFYYLKVTGQSGFKQKIRSIWSDVVQESKAFNETTAAVGSTSELKNVSDEASSLYELVTRKQTEVVALETPNNYVAVQDNLAKALSKYADYILAVRILLNKNALTIQSKDFRNIDSKAEEAILAVQNFLGSCPFVQTELPKEVFEITKTIEPLTKEAQKQSQVKQVEAQKQQQEADKLEATKTITDFMQARIQDNFVAMRRYLTPNENKYFDPEEEKKAQGSSHPVDFEVTNVVANADGSFTVEGEETNKDYLGRSVIYRWRFKVIKYQSLWLIDKRELLQ